MDLQLVRVTYLDESVAESLTKSYMGTGDRIAFEHQFGVNSGVLMNLTNMLEDEDEHGDRKLKEGADLSQFREEWLAFFAWRVLSRSGEVRPFDQWVDQVSGIEIIKQQEGAEPDPTGRTPPPA